MIVTDGACRSCSLSVFGTLKEVYLLSKFVIRVVSSAVKHQVERTRLHLQFRHEFLFLRSFGALLTRKGNKVLDDGELDRDWLKHIGNILEQLRIAYGDYAKVAEAEDDEYKRFSPYSTANTEISQSIDFSLDIEQSSGDQRTIEEKGGTIFRLTEYARRLKQSDWRWALFQKHKLENVLADLKVENQMLRELVPMTIAAGKSNTAQSSPLEEKISEEDRGRLGLILHSRLYKMNTEGHSDELAIRLDSYALETSEVPSNMPLSYGVLSFDNDSREEILIEYKPIVQRSNPAATGNEVEQSQVTSCPDPGAEKLANLLRLARDSEFRILPFIGYVERQSMEPPQYAFLFQYPKGALKQFPISLHELLVSESPNISLEARFLIAKKVATSVWMLHADNWVHKSILSQSVVFFYGPGGTITHKDPYLVNFEYSRPAQQVTTWTWDQDENKNLYRHPDRQGPPTKAFSKTHDVYALGVVLLEIGLLQVASKMRDTAKQARGRERLDRYELRNTYITLAKQRLPQLMGLAYRNAVLTCLVGDFGCQVHENSFGMAFYEKVVQELDINRLLSSARTLSAELL